MDSLENPVNLLNLFSLQVVFAHFVEVIQPVLLVIVKADVQSPFPEILIKLMNLAEILLHLHLRFGLFDHVVGDLPHPFLESLLQLLFVVVRVIGCLPQGSQAVMEIVFQLLQIADALHVVHFLPHIDPVPEIHGQNPMGFISG